MTKIQLISLIDNIPLNKNSARCAKKCFFIILVTAIKSRSTPEIRILPGKLRFTPLPKERYSDSLSGRWSNTNLPIEGADTLPLSYRRGPRPREMFVANGQASYDVMMCRWGVTEKTTIWQKGWSWPWLFTVTSCKAFLIRFWKEGQYKARTTRTLMFASLRSNVISFLCSKDFWLGRPKYLCLERKV